MLRKLNVLALAAGLALATGPPAIAQGTPQGMPPQGMPSQGMPMGSMKTTKDLDDQKRARADEEMDRALKQAPNQAQAPTYRDTPEDRIMREKTDDGAHDRIDTQRQQ